MSFNAKSESGEPHYGNVQTFGQNGFSTIYYPHPDDDVDLACVNISGISDSNIYFKNLHDAFLEPIDLGAIPPGSDVIFIGYPENRFDVKHNLPIIRKGSIASVPSVDFNGRPQIVIDAQVFQGSSGSPVFVATGGHYRLLGVVSETMIRHAQLQTISVGHASLAVQQILGLGIVIKQSKVVELIKHTIDAITKLIATPNE
ncbi:MAG: S1 family peptidase [Methylosarcina sp.]